MYSRNKSLFINDIRYTDQSSAPPLLKSATTHGMTSTEEERTHSPKATQGNKVRQLRMLPQKRQPRPSLPTRGGNHVPDTLPFPTTLVPTTTKQPHNPITKHTLQSRRKVYGVPPKSTLHETVAASRKRHLDPLDARTIQAALQHDVSEIQDTMHRVAKNIPIQFLMETNHRDFALQVATETVWRILVANWTLAQRQAMHQWLKWTLQARQLDHVAKRQLLEKQAGLARCLHIAQSRLHRFMQTRFYMWHGEANRRTSELRVNMALSIQCAWRQKLARHAVAHIHARHDRIKQHHAATCIQRRVRGMQGRRRASGVAYATLTRTSARIIQRAFRRFMVAQLHWRQVKQLRALDIQRVWRGMEGRQRAVARRQVVHATAIDFYNADAAASLIRCTSYLCAILAIQRCIRHHLARQHVTTGLQTLARRQQCFPRIRLQRSWRRYRRAVLAGAVDDVVRTLVVMAKHLARKVVHHCAMLARAKQRQRATAIQCLVRGALARMHVNAAQRDTWTALDRQLPRCDKAYLEWDVLTAVERTKCVVVWRRKVSRWRDACATDIQRMFRGHAVRKVYQVRQRACGELRHLLNRPVHRYLRRLKARRVRGRWRRHHHTTLASTVLAWKGITQALQRIKTLRHSERQRHVAQWHFEKKQRRRMLYHWGNCVRVQQGRTHRAMLATHFSNRHILTRAMEQWRRGTLVEILQHIVCKHAMLVDVFQRWAGHTALLKRAHQLRNKIHGRIKADLVEHWRQLHILHHVLGAIAIEHANRALARSHLTALRTLTRRHLLVTKRCIRLGSRDGVHAWVEWVGVLQFHRAQRERGRLFRIRHLFAQWQTLPALQNAAACRRHRLDMFANAWKAKRALVQWVDRTDVAREYHVLHGKSQGLFSRTFRRKAFAEWYKLWAETAGKRRIASALRVQAAWRGKRGRRQFAKAKALHRYKMAKRIERGADSPECTVDGITTLLQTKQWVILYAYLPWEPPTLPQRRAFCTIATKLHLKRDIVFGFCDATQLDPGTMVSLATRLKLKSRLPSISVFWQGRGPENETLRDPARRIARRFTKVDMQFHGFVAMTSDTLGAFVDQLFQNAQHAAATDIQAILRGTLVRMRIYYARQYRHRNVATSIVWWFVRQCRRRRHKNATKLERWYRRRMAQHRAWNTAKARMVELRKPVQLIQRVVRHYFSRVQYGRARDERRATPELYPHAALCMTCERRVGMTKCTDCDEPYCDDCFAMFHQQGSRADHRAVSMDFIAMDKNWCMCRRCHVRSTRRVCVECRIGLCILCFEKVHSMRSGLHGHRFRRPVKLVLDETKRKTKRRFQMPMLLCSDLAQDVITQHGWPTKSRVDAAAAAVEAARLAADSRERQIQAICAMLEKPVLDAFQVYDPDHEGFIGIGELRMLLTQELCIPVRKRDIQAIVANIDINHDGHLGWNEIVRWLAVQVVDGTFRGPVRAVRRSQLRVHKRYRNAAQRYREFQRAFHGRFPSRRAKKRMVSLYPDVGQLHPVDDFQRKKHVFYRFLQTEFAMAWILDDIHVIDLDNQMKVFADVFVPRWNAGALGYDYYYDGVTFEHKATLFEQKWDRDLHKYVFWNVATHDAHLVDPRKEDVLYAMAFDAFNEVDVDGSGDVDVNELYTLLNENLCEPMPMHQVIQVMHSIDQDGSGTISFHEFYAWYGSEYSQQHVKSVKHDGLKMALRTRRNAKRLAAKSYRAGVKHGSMMIQGVKNRMEQRRLQADCANADPEMVELLMEGYEKHMVQKALMMSHNDVNKARDWLAHKKEEAAFDAAKKREELRRRRQEQLQVLRAVQTSTKQGLVSVASAIKAMLFGKPANGDAEVDAILKNLKMEIDGAREIVQDELDPQY
ncbi:hypothetical protein H310_00749 [Aphanomyces invadans]|uniref:Uncharacterized protein n=1 Tax=Aphanomyces invadans TaxID=157072 RepID=A0A024UVU5_9STRA|nr:hypothetical protein H310_00749 [Aphanomyces invadans]ETW10444.1 hypothetical protein H310_00749 [Aphanomyces invadans]|eukprot:XP_008861855.1 hypothetical protein H310_00749 [Aphanomyces invadans]